MSVHIRSKKSSRLRTIGVLFAALLLIFFGCGGGGNGGGNSGDRGGDDGGGGPARARVAHAADAERDAFRDRSRRRRTARVRGCELQDAGDR